MIASIRLYPTYVRGKRLDFGNICIMDVLFLPDFCKKYIFPTDNIMSDFLIIQRINDILGININDSKFNFDH